MKRNVMLYLAILAFCLAIQPITMASSFDFELVDFPGADSTEACGINNRGQVVGRYWDLNGGYGYLLDKGLFTTIDFPGAWSTDAYGINDRGQVVGGYWDETIAAWTLVNQGFRAFS